MSIATRIICSLGALFMTSAVAFGQKGGDELVQVKLLADTNAVVAGKPFTVGVNLKIEPKWHIYWINPGDSGAATKVAWNLPPGCTASELKFPVPERIVLPGDIVSYGYEDEVTLTATITPPSDLKPGANVTIGAKADWLVCEEICLPGGGEAKLELPVSESVGSANTDLFKKIWFPSAASSSEKVSVSATPLDLSNGKGKSEIRLANVDASSEIEVFPYPLDKVNVSIGEPKRNGNETIIPITVSVLPNQKVSAKTWTVLVVSRNGSTGRLAYDVPITIVTGGAGASPPQGSMK